MPRQRDAFGTGAHGDAFAFEDLADRLRDVLVLAPDQPRTHLDNRHPGAEPPVHLREFEPDIAATDHDQVLGDAVQLQDRAVGQKRNLVDAREVRHRARGRRH